MREVIRLDVDDIHVPDAMMAARLGFKGLKSIPDQFASRFDSALQTVKERSVPISVVDETTISMDGDVVRLDGQEVPGQLARKHLGGAGSISLVLTTLGAGVDEVIAQATSEGDTLGSFLMDGIASELVEFAVRKIDYRLRQGRPAASGGTRISPGYGDLPLSLNGWLVDRLGGAEIGVSCRRDSFTFVPRKTVAAMIAWKDHGQA